MKIEVLLALNGDSILIEYVPTHFVLIDGVNIDTCQNFLAARSSVLL